MPDRKEQHYEKILHDAGCSEKVIAHCRAVTDCAREYALNNPDIDMDLVLAGAMLHDIGRSKTHTIHHAQMGADLLRDMGFPEELARVVECHTGAGLTADECTLLGVSPRDCVPASTEEKIVTHADNLIAGRRRVSIENSIASAIHLPRKARKRMYRLSLEVEMLCRG
ncbi:HD domain-containing protein [uncultured Methanoregula sp.]|uniref:HD domain-containing protein n=1 Tax=uncultured Methanoregula sp. TaxID=1005933 RepID=UPI002AAAE5E6|nr:HD domain-containing protein [uncultured Methanoregula sp.]